MVVVVLVGAGQASAEPREWLDSSDLGGVNCSLIACCLFIRKLALKPEPQDDRRRPLMFGPPALSWPFGSLDKDADELTSCWSAPALGSSGSRRPAGDKQGDLHDEELISTVGCCCCCWCCESKVK